MKILLGITGSVAAIKSYELVMKLVANNHELKTILTYNGEKFTSTYILDKLGANITRYNCDNFPHIQLNSWADLILICPATANIIAKFANGISDDLISLIGLIGKSKLIIVPAMNNEMWLDQAVRSNVKKLKEMNVHFIGPINGQLACGNKDLGHIAEIKDIICTANIREITKNDQKNLFPLKDKNILIINGKTNEPIDKIRFISNKSSGKMGYALASVCREMGANTTLIQNAKEYHNPCNIDIIDVETADQMLEQAILHIDNKDIIINVAAVTDIKYKNPQKNKINKSNLINKQFEIELNPDILEEIAKKAKNQSKKPILVGFCVEEKNNLIKSAEKKLIAKNLDLIIANPLESFGSNDTECNILYKANDKTENLEITHQSKLRTAVEIIKTIIKFI